MKDFSNRYKDCLLRIDLSLPRIKTMKEKYYKTELGDICYWVSEEKKAGGIIDEVNPEIASRSQDYTLALLPGLTADHRLFDPQIQAFEGKYKLFTWDAPGHGASRPFRLDFDLFQKARWLEEIFLAENLAKPVIIGQSMGGYVGQAYAQLFPERLAGFISIDSAPLGREYTTAAEIWMLKHTEGMYRSFPWKLLMKLGSEGVATSPYGRQLMAEMMSAYSGDQNYYAKLSGHGFNMLAEAMEKKLSYRIDCPALLICGEEDHAGSAKRYNKAWHKKTGIPIEWIAGAGHNSNTDKPDEVNGLIETFLRQLQA